MKAKRFMNKLNKTDKIFLINTIVICYEFLNKNNSLDSFEFGLESNLSKYKDWISDSLKKHMISFVNDLEIDRYMYDFNDKSEEIKKRANNLLNYSKDMICFKNYENLED